MAMQSHLPPADGSKQRAARTILFVDDHHELRTPVAELLRMHGYMVLEAASPREAILISGVGTLRIDVLLADVNMAEITGDKLAKRLRSSRPDLRVLLMSGYPKDMLDMEILKEPGTTFVQKPISTQALAIAVKQLLNGTMCDDEGD